MPTALKLHPDNSDTAINIIRADAFWSEPDKVSCWFRAAGTISKIVVPRAGNERDVFGYQGWEFGEKLWEHTCFEAFVSFDGVPGYFELHLTTSARWASYEFSGYREGMKRARGVDFYTGSWTVGERQIEVGGRFTIPPELRNRTMRVGLAAIIEEDSRKKSFWALKHPPGRPDYHHRDCFVIELPPPVRK